MKDGEDFKFHGATIIQHDAIQVTREVIKRSEDLATDIGKAMAALPDTLMVDVIRDVKLAMIARFGGSMPADRLNAITIGVAANICADGVIELFPSEPFGLSYARDPRLRAVKMVFEKQFDGATRARLRRRAARLKGSVL